MNLHVTSSQIIIELPPSSVRQQFLQFYYQYDRLNFKNDLE